MDKFHYFNEEHEHVKTANSISSSVMKLPGQHQRRYGRSLMDESFKHLITKSDKTERTVDNDVQDNKEQNLNNVKETIYEYTSGGSNIVMTTEIEKHNEDDEDDEDDKSNDNDGIDRDTIKSNYDKQFLKDEEEIVSTTFKTFTSAQRLGNEEISSTTTTLTKVAFETSSSSPLNVITSPSPSIKLKVVDDDGDDDDDKTLKINNILNLNQSNNQNINKDYNNENEKNEQNDENVLRHTKEPAYLSDTVATALQDNKLPSEHNNEELKEQDIETTTKMFTIFENYNYDEEEALDINDGRDLNFILSKEDENENLSQEFVLTALNNDEFIDDDKLLEKYNNEQMASTSNSNSKSYRKHKSTRNQLNDNNNSNNDDDTDDTDDDNDKYDKDDGNNNFQINRFEINQQNLDSMTVNSHHFSDSYDDIYLSDRTKENFQNEQEKLKEKLTASISTPNRKAEQDSLENLMLNDGLWPLNVVQPGFVNLNYNHNLDDVDIVKLENTHSNEEELYKTINATLVKNNHKKFKFQLNPHQSYDKNQNEVLRLPEDMNPEINKPSLNVKPITSNPFTTTTTEQPLLTHQTSLTSDHLEEKRIIVNLSIASNDGSGNRYTLHVNIPAFDQNGEVQNMQQTLTHDKIPQIKENFKQQDIKQDLKTSPYCIPEPPPPIPECPCPCTGALYTKAADLYSTDLEDNNNDWLEETTTSVLTEETITTSTITNDSITNTATTTTPYTFSSSTAFATVNDDSQETNTNDNNVSVDYYDTSTNTTTVSNLLAGIDNAVLTTVNLTNNFENNRPQPLNENGEKFACPDVMPILILEGDLFCFK